jgi:HPt (histidine-containing phosphotransfer) domain-containing protein
MDCQMPIMDGYDATQAIREMEMRENRSHTPVIAMTANAMKGDKETCLRMGMDAYVSKPIDISRTQHAIRTCWHITNDADTDVSLQPEALHNEMDAPVNMEHLSMFTDGDAEEECALFSIFLQNAQHTLNLLRESAQKQDPEAWRKAAHLLKGASGNLGAQHLFACCSKAEEKAKAGKITVFDEDLQAIECALEDVTQFIHTRAA